MMKFPNFGQRRSNQNSIDSVSNAEAPIQPEDTLEDEMAGLSAEEAAEIRDAFNVILHSDQDPMVAAETAADIEGPLAAEPDFLAVDAVQPDAVQPDTVQPDVVHQVELEPTPNPMAVEPTLDSPQASLMSKLDLDITPLVVPTVLTESIEQLNPYELSQDLAQAEEPPAADVDLDLADVDLDLTVDAVDAVSDEPEAAALEESSYDIHTDGPLTYFQYYLDGDSGEAAEYNPVSLRRPSMPTGLVGAGILGAALVSGFSIADAMKQSQPVAKRPTPSPLQDLNEPGPRPPPRGSAPPRKVSSLKSRPSPRRPR
ncbi:MAG: hypothetical protein HC860_23165, partial [Alkalinema sp. RU_4_3]|nr:hypothetical protein [Alkalinema sp. RU_4_3]